MDPDDISPLAAFVLFGHQRPRVEGDEEEVGHAFDEDRDGKRGTRFLPTKRYTKRYLRAPGTTSYRTGWVLQYRSLDQAAVQECFLQGDWRKVAKLMTVLTLEWQVAVPPSVPHAHQLAALATLHSYKNRKLRHHKTRGGLVEETFRSMLEVFRQHCAGRGKIEGFLKAMHDLQGSRAKKVSVLLELVTHLCEHGNISQARGVLSAILKRRGQGSRLTDNGKFHCNAMAGLIGHRAILSNIEQKGNEYGIPISKQPGLPPVGFQSAVDLIDKSMKADLASAKANLRNALDAVPDATPVGYTLVHLETMEGNWHEARRLARHLAKAAENDRDAHLLSAGIHEAEVGSKGGLKSVAKAYFEALRCDPYASAAVHGLVEISKRGSISQKCRGWVAKGMVRHLDVCHPSRNMPLAPKCWDVLAQNLIAMAVARLEEGKEREWETVQPCLQGAASWWGAYHFRSASVMHTSKEGCDNSMLRNKAICALLIWGCDNKFSQAARKALDPGSEEAVEKAAALAERLGVSQCLQA
ncbi:unnamed protein product [Ostreobium quekettii]|uniref:Uncharacterized protein n=1 Tax=Ostreobium quekettii TaxID=121088 RepID=A0A8S1IL71_9CHLO|nr:unnamed protein product [Ostreobium quekettii]|eukprot:evm.model.scf_5.8 EVM.evm.TU.scf_5.8   scf_5:76513-81031(+)